MSDTQVLDRPTVSVTASAAKRIAEILKEDGTPGMMLRIAVSGGGCSGFQYGFTLDDARADDDVAVVRDGVTVLVDSVSIEYMQGAEVDFVEDMIGASFQIKNPNATSKCGCGSSFSV
ncbi:MAG TPA: iron-sulfur cluster insertion protein ErpA [Candidatus Cybelea sp.]|nr:iron-sulfur cluster insertion protein ErpA [Candidatus Cybelea sp.]